MATIAIGVLAGVYSAPRGTDLADGGAPSCFTVIRGDTNRRVA